MTKEREKMLIAERKQLLKAINQVSHAYTKLDRQADKLWKRIDKIEDQLFRAGGLSAEAR